MRKVLTALLTAGCFAAATALTASTANAQVDAWNGGWHVGGDYYYPTYSSYSAAPIYDYGSAPAYGAAEYSYGSAPLYDYGTVAAYSPPGYSYASAPLYNYAAAPAAVAAYGPAGYSYGSPALYNYGAVPGYGPAVVGAQIQPVQTVEIVRTVYVPERPAARRLTTARQTTARQTTAHRTAEVAHSTPQQNNTASNVAAPAYQNAAYYNYAGGNAHPLSDTAAAPVAQPVAATVNAGPAYRYVYQRDRILVIDPSTNAVVQTLRR
jgi:hypothetical protein